MTNRTGAKVNAAVLALLVAGATAIPAAAQPIGTFRWQLTSFCNVVELSVTQTGVSATTPPTPVYQLQGFDDQCGGARAGVVGTAFFHQDGTVGIALTTVLVSGGRPIHIEARIDVATLSGTWQDDAGNSGAFVFTPGAGSGGAVRPAATSPTAGPGAPHAPTSPAPTTPGPTVVVGLTPGSVGAAHVNPNEVQLRVTGSCPVGQYLRGVAADGSVVCDTLPSIAAIGTCPSGQSLRGIGPGGNLICEPQLRLNLTTTAHDTAAASVGKYTSIAVSADGRPVISHFGDFAGLLVTKCGNAACTLDNVTTPADTKPDAGLDTSIAIPGDGRPVISHYDAGLHALRVTKCGNPACSMGNVSTTVDDPANEVGRESSIAIGADGFPVISYQDVTASRLWVTKCGNAECSAGNSTTIVDDIGENQGFHTSIAVGADGLPVISYLNSLRGALRVTKCGNPACTAGNTSTTVDDVANTVGSYSSIAIAPDNFPVISHHDFTAGALRVTKCGNAACTADNVTTVVDDPVNFVGQYTSIAIGGDGLPVIGYNDVGASALRVTKCGNAACTAGNVSTTIEDSDANVGQHTSLAIGADQLPVISYYNFTDGSLRVTKCATGTCQ